MTVLSYMLQNYRTYRVLKVFFDFPLKKFSLKEISLLSKLSHPSLKPELSNLIKSEFLQKHIEIRGKRSFPLYFASENEEFKKIKKLSNEYELIYSGIIEFLKSKMMPNSIIVFGSYSRGEDLEESDIDLFVESEIKEIDLKKFEKKLKRKINLTFKEDLNKLDKNLLINIINGKILYGEIHLK